MLLSGKEIWRQLTKLAGSTQQRAWIASAYITSKRLEKLCSAVPESVSDKCILVRWQISDLVNGASDLESYLVARKSGWRFFVNINLHAKIYLFDEGCLSGSANLTYKGMCGVSPPGNHELVEDRVDVAEAAEWYASVKRNSCELDDELFERITRNVRSMDDGANNLAVVDRSYEGSLLSDLTANWDIELFTEDLFWSDGRGKRESKDTEERIDGDVKHDMSLLGVEDYNDLRAIGERFTVSKAFRWLLRTVEKETYYGELTSCLHSQLHDDPKPYRKDVKSLVSNLLAWTSVYGKKYFFIDRPNISQRITRVG